MINKILKFAEDYSLCGKTVIVAFSGGYDSMCLLDIMDKISSKTKINLIAAHYNHNWRGEESKQEQLHCKDFCNKRGIKFYTETAPDDIKKTETVARDLRYDFLSRTAKKYETDIVLTAHNYDDNVETVLYRIIKGTGIVGLGGISAIRDIYYRPLLNISREEIEKYCVENNLKPNNDSSNNNTKYKRNFIRHKIIPLLQEINPEVKKAIYSLSEISKSQSDITDEFLECLAEKIFEKDKIIKKEYVKLSEAVKMNLIYNLLYRTEQDYDYEKIQYIYNFIEKTIELNKPSKISITDNKWIYIGNEYIEVIGAVNYLSDEINITGEGEYNIGKALVKLEKCCVREKTQNEYSAYIDLSNFTDLKLRTRRDGDIIVPLGMVGSMKLKEYLINKKIPQHKRDKLILLAGESEVLWVGGVGLSDKIKTTGVPTHKISIIYGEEQ